MQIRTTVPKNPRPLSKAAPQEKTLSAPKPDDGWLAPVKDFGVVARLLSIGQLYRMKESSLAKEVAANPPLEGQKPVDIEQPVVFVPGWKTTREAFDPLAAKLLEGGRNGGEIIFVSQGKLFADRECQKLCSESMLNQNEHKVFEVVFSDVRLPPDQSSEELKTNLEAVRQYSGAEKLDVNAYSMGGLATRAYLDKGGDAIDQVMFLGTPHRGAKFADLARHVLRRDIGWAVSFAGLLPADLPALDWLSPEADGNPQLKALNERWPEQKARVTEAEFIGGTGIMTADGGLWPVTDGDGLVALEFAAPPGEKAIPLPGGHHTFLNDDPVVYNEMKDYFGWKASE